MSAAGSFKDARAALREVRTKLTAIDDVLGLMDMLADSIRHRGFVPELVYDARTGTVSLNCRVGQLPPRVSVTMEDLPPEPVAPPVPAAAPKPSLGDLSDAAQGLGRLEPAPPVVIETIKLPPAFAPKTVAEAGKPTPPGPTRLTQYKTGEWSTAEERRLLELHDAGRMIPDMVAELGRKGPGIAARLRYLLAKRTASAAPDMGIPMSKPAPVAPPPPRPAAPAPAAGPVLPPGPSLPRLQRAAEARLVAATDADWPAQRDLDLMERMARGDCAGATAEAMGIGKHDVLCRWKSLFPEVPSIEGQAAMLAVLRARCAAVA